MTRAGRQRGFVPDRQREQRAAVCPGRVRRRDGGLHDDGHDPGRTGRSVVHERVVGRPDASVELRPSASGPGRYQQPQPSGGQRRSGARDDDSSRTNAVVNCQCVSGQVLTCARRRWRVAAPRVHADRAAGGDLDHPARQCGGVAGGLAGALAPPGERGGPAASRCAGRAHGIRPSQNGTPSGIRLLPDPAFPLIYRLDQRARSTRPSRWRPTGSFRSKRRRSIRKGCCRSNTRATFTLNVPYPAINGGGNYPYRQRQHRSGRQRSHGQGAGASSITATAQTRSNNPTSWFWNIRVGDKLQINGSGLWYTVVGPMVVTPPATAIPSCS